MAWSLCAGVLWLWLRSCLPPAPERLFLSRGSGSGRRNLYLFACCMLLADAFIIIKYRHRYSLFNLQFATCRLETVWSATRPHSHSMHIDIDIGKFRVHLHLHLKLKLRLLLENGLHILHTRAIYGGLCGMPACGQAVETVSVRLGCSVAYSIYSIGGCCYTCYIVYYTIVLHSVLDANFGI